MEKKINFQRYYSERIPCLCSRSLQRSSCCGSPQNITFTLDKENEDEIKSCNLSVSWNEIAVIPNLINCHIELTNWIKGPEN